MAHGGLAVCYTIERIGAIGAVEISEVAGALRLREPAVELATSSSADWTACASSTSLTPSAATDLPAEQVGQRRWDGRYGTRVMSTPAINLERRGWLAGAFA